MKALLATVAVSILLATPALAQDTPILDKVAAKVVEKYKMSSCAELRAKKAEPPSEMAVRAVGFLKSDPAMRVKFIDMVAGPIANKMFDCGMIP